MFHVALREEIIPKGNPDDLITAQEIGAIMLNMSTKTRNHLIPGADRHTIDLFAKVITEKVISVYEAQIILGKLDIISIKTMLAL